MDSKPSIDGYRPRRETPSAPPVPASPQPVSGQPPQAAASLSPKPSAESIWRRPVPDASAAQKGDIATDSTSVGESPAPPRHNRLVRILRGYWPHKLWTLPLTLLVIAGVLLALPSVRFRLIAMAGTARPYSVVVTDAKTNTPVSGASVLIGDQSAKTDSSGHATLTVRVGKAELAVSKKYYQDTAVAVFVGLKPDANKSSVRLTATGRQVTLTVRDKITGQGVAEARVAVLDTEARTDAKGTATIVLPTSSPTQPATVSADGYNEANVQIQVTDQNVPSNTFDLTPAGHVYFLSNQSGNIDVVSANLDGSGRSTVAAGTGNEDPNNTVLIPARDWTSLALVSKRDVSSTDAKLYMISTKDGKLTTVDSGPGLITAVGWSDHVFVYQIVHYSANAWTPGQTELKSYDTDAGKLATIDQSSAMGTDTQYIHQSLAFANIVGSRVVYGFDWADAYGNYDPNRLGGQKNSMLSASVSGSNRQSLLDVPIGNGVTYSYMSSVLIKPQQLYVASTIGTQPAVYYSYQPGNNSVTQSNTMTDPAYQHAQANSTTYLVSPSGKSAFWDQPRDGKYALFVGDSDGSNGTQVGQADVYAPYGWFTDNYLLVQKGSSELYVMSSSGGTPVKVSDVYKPQHGFYGYGGV